MRLGLGRLCWGWMAFCAAPVAVGLAAIPAPAYAEPSAAEALKADFDAWSSDTSNLLGDLANFRDNLLPRYQCPPAQPNKEAKFRELNQLARRLNLLRARQRGIEDRRTELGRAGEGQVSSGIRDRIKEELFGPGAARNILITDADMKRVENLLTRMGSSIRDLVRELRNIPPTAKDCDPRTDPIRTVTFNAPSQDPGSNVRAQVAATTASGKAVIISSVTVGGIDQIGAAGAVGGLGTANATYNFDIADVRRQGPFNLNVTVSGLPAGFPAGTAALSQSINVNYTVNNVAPTIDSVPDGPKAKPGDPLTLEGQVVVVDRNADNRNASEVTRSMVTLDGHPDGLETMPGQAFQRFSTVRQVSHDAATGRYVFDVKRVAATRKPHAHGKFPTRITVADRRGASAGEGIDLIIENVAPTLSLRVLPTRHYHSGDGKQVLIVGAVADDNSADDIEEIEIDARQAGGALYRLSAGSVVKTGRPADDGYSFRIDPASFGHTDSSGEWPITAVARDDGAPEQGDPTPLTATLNTSITVTNLKPEIGSIGYLSNLGLIPGKKNVCPRELIRVGVMVNDPEGDTLKVEAVIRETGQRTILQIEPLNSTHTGYVLAPDAPGDYHIDFVVTEQGVNNPHTVSKSIELTVESCDDGVGIVVVVEGPPRSQVKIGPVPPALPGELPGNLADVFAYARMLQLAAILDDLGTNIGDTTYPGMPPLTLLVLGSFWQDFLLKRPDKLMEDGADHPDGTCGAGDGEGPVFGTGTYAPGSPPQDPGLGFFDRLFRDAIDKAKQAPTTPDDNDFTLGMGYKWRSADRWNTRLRLLQGGFDGAEQAPTAPEDDDFKLDLGYKWRPTDQWNLRLEYDYEDSGDEDLDDLDYDFDLGLKWKLTPTFGLRLEYSDWIDEEFGDPVPSAPRPDPAKQARDRAAADAEAQRRAAAEKAAEKTRLQKKSDALTARQQNLNRAITNTQSDINATDDKKEKARLRGQLNELQGYADTIHDQSVVIDTRLNELDKDKIAAETALRNEIANDINRYASKAIAEIIGIDETLQDAKETVTWGTRWISSGSKMQYETRKGTRLADRELAAANVKLGIVDVLMDFAQPGSTEMTILEEFKGRYERQKAAAEELLSSNSNITMAGYAIDFGLTITGAKLVQWGKTAIAAGASRALAPAAAETVIANTTERGLIELSKNALGRSAATEAAAGGTANVAASGTANVAERSASQLYDDAVQAAANASKTEVDNVLGHALNASRTEVMGAAAGQVAARTAEKPLSGALRQMAGEAASEAEARALREAAELVERTAAQHGGDEFKALNQLWDEVVGSDLLPKAPGTQWLGQAMDDAVVRAREAMASPAGQRAAANAPAAAAGQANQRAAEILGQRYGSEGGKKVLDSARNKVKDWVDDIDFGSSSFYAVPFLLGLMAQEGYAEEAPQTTLDDTGRGSVEYFSPTFSGFTFSTDYGNDDQNGDDDQWDLALRYAGEFGGVWVAGRAKPATSDFDGIDVTTDSEIFYAPKITLENGLTIGGGGPAHGGYIESDGSVFLSGAFGTLTLGDTDAAFDKALSSPTLGDTDSAYKYSGGVSYDPFVSNSFENSCRIKKIELPEAGGGQ